MPYVLTALTIVAMLPVGIFLFVSLWAWRVPDPPVRGSRSRRVLVVVAAHDEERVIEGLLQDLAAQDYEPDRLEVLVVADRCTDATAVVASPYATVFERTEGVGTKGAAIGWLLDQVTVSPDDLLVVLDADNRLGSDVVGFLVDAADSGIDVMQARLEPANPDASKVALAGSMSQWMSNRLIDLAHRNLGMSSSILGTGFAVTGGRLADLTTDDGGVTEDRDLNDRLALEGEPVTWLHHIGVYDEKPTSIDVLTRQRARWYQGKRESRWMAFRSLLFGSGRLTATRIDRALHLLLPGRTISLALLVVLGVVGSVWPSSSLVPAWVVWAFVGAALVVSVAGLAAERAGWRRIVQLPLLAVFALIWLPERLIARRSGGWYHTPHGDTSDA